MAIFDFVPGIEVTVCVDGQPLPEFDDDDDSAKLAQAHSPQSLEEYCAKRTVSRYVQSIDDKDFTVRCEIRPPYQMDCPGLAIFLEVDHRHIDGRWIMKNGANSVEMKGLTTGARGTEVFQPIKFTKIKLATGKDMDSSQIKKDSELMSKVGTIVIEIFRAEVDASKAPRTGNGKLGIDASGEVDEKSLKGDAKSHRAGFGRPKPAPPSRTTEPKYLDGPDYPLAIFKFKYRSEGMHHVPYEPSITLSI
ncbi:hypothetical protein PVAG01_04388 [Phlyctema vagabunda]|uniref:DUF7918 domain-containing protein n=1 Tax=Phlyctema vagabunda TaxID=108571 RepID=A0ABR4PPS8_9HELO